MMVIFRAVVNQSETTPRICPIDASAIAQPGSLYKVDLGTRLQIQFVLCSRPVGIVKRDVQKAGGMEAWAHENRVAVALGFFNNYYEKL